MNSVFFALERASLFGFAALLVALGVQMILDGRAPAAWRVWIWRVALLQTALALVPLAPFRLAVLPASSPVAARRVPKNEAPRLPIAAPLPPAAASAPPSGSASNAPADSLPTAPLVEAPPHQITASAPDSALQPRRFFSPWPVLIGFYGLGWGFQLVALARCFRRVRRLLRACISLEDTATGVQLGEVARRMGVSPLPRLLEIEGGAPFLSGTLRPAIVLPRALLAAPKSDLEAVLAHELAHLKRRDLVWNALLWFVQTLLWFHPLVWAARRFLSLETESACDEMVLTATRITPQSYGALLLNTMNTPQTPLTAGVADGFFALKTRLVRLNRTPQRPHRAVRVAFAAALCVAFGALIPLRFVARAQSEAPLSPKVSLVSGTVVDQAGKPVAGVTVYAMGEMRNGSEALETAVSDANGRFAFSPKVRGKWGISVFADVGPRGMGQETVYLQGERKPKPVTVRLAPVVRARLRFLDPQGRPAANLTVRLWRVGASGNSWMALPKSVLQTMWATTNARGEAIFPPLPANTIAQFRLDDERQVHSRLGMGDRRGGRFAPLSIEDLVSLRAPQTGKTIRLLAPISIAGRVWFPDGRGAGNVLILARRINAAEAAGKTQERDQLIAQTRSNAAGKYVLDGLRPGRYYVWTYPEKQLTRNWIGQSYEKSLAAKTNRVDFALSRGAIIQGVVVAQNTKQPVKGQTMGLFDSQENYQYAITDARGFFQFRALGGKQHLWVHANGTNSPPPGFILPAKSEFDFSIKNGEKREFKIEMPDAPVVKPTTGTVVGPDGNAVPNATVLYHALGGRDSELHRAQTDASGHFSLPLSRWSARPTQLWAEAGELTTPHGLIALPGEAVALRLEAGVWASVEGQIADEKKQPLSGVQVQLYSVVSNVYVRAREVKTDANGRFRFERLQPGMSVMLRTHLDGYDDGNQFPQDLERGQHHTFNITMPRASATLSGRVVGEDGKPARGYQISASGSSRAAVTGSDGRFFLPQVLSGAIPVHVYYTSQGTIGWIGWSGFSARGGDKNVLIRLSKAKRVERFYRSKVAKSGVTPASQIGKVAPEIRVARWAGGKATPLSSLHGQVVLLAFGSFNFNPNAEVNDVARSFEGRLQVVGIQANFRTRLHPKIDLDVDKAARGLPFPLALDAPLPQPNGIGGLTFASYGNASYAVIGRDGRVIYAGDELDRAIVFALSPSNPKRPLPGPR